MLNQNGQATGLPSTDPSGMGTENWEVEEALDVEWAHAIAPGARIILVEANSQSLPDLMTGVATAAAQPGVSVVSMSWGFQEGQSVLAADEAAYDNVFKVPGVTFVASTGDYGAADPEYPAFSPNVLAVGGTTLSLNADNSYNSEAGWGYNSSAAGRVRRFGRRDQPLRVRAGLSAGRTVHGLSHHSRRRTGGRPGHGRLDRRPVQSRSQQPVRGRWRHEPVGTGVGGLLALVNQGRMAAGEATLNSVSSTDTQQALYKLPQSNYNVIAAGNNGYTATTGYNLVTGLGTPVANLLVPNLISYQGPATSYAGEAVGPLQSTTFVDPTAVSSDPTVVFSVLDAMVAGSASVRTGTKQLTVPRASSAQHLATGLLSPELTVLDSVIENWTPVRGSAVEPHAATSTVSSDSGSTMKLNILPAIRSGQPGLVIDLGILEVPGSGTAIGSRLRKSLFF